MKMISSLFVFVLLLTSAFSVKAQIVTTETGRKALEKSAQGDSNGALVILNKAIEKKKDLKEALPLRAQILSSTGNFDGAIADLTDAIELSSKESELYKERGLFRMLQGKDLPEALKDFDLAIALGTRTDEIYSLKASTYRSLGNTDAAIESYQLAISVNPDSAQAFLGLTELLFSKGDEENAINQLRAFLERFEAQRDGKLPKVRGETVTPSKVVKTEKIEGQEAAMVTGQNTMTFSSDLTPEQLQKKLLNFQNKKYLATAYARLGFMYEKHGNLDEALTAVNKALQIDENVVGSYSTRGKIHLQKGNYNEAVEDFSKAIKMIPSFGNNYADRGIAYLLQNKEVEAQKDFDKYLQLMPQGKEPLDKRIADAKEKRLQ